MRRRTFLFGTAAALAAGPAFGQDGFPSRPITIVNAFPPGGANDLVTRPIASAMESVLKQPVVVETKAGAGGQVAKSDQFKTMMTNIGDEVAYLDAPDFAKFWDEDAKRVEAAVASIGRVQG